MESLKIKQTRAAKVNELAALKAKITDAPTDAQKAEMRTLLDDIDNLTEQVELALRMEKQAAEQATREAEERGLNNRNENTPDGKPKTPKGGENRSRRELMQRASIARAISAQLAGKKLEGAEAEMMQEGDAELRAFNKSSEGIAVPSFFFAEKRALSVGSAPSAGVTVNTEEGGLIEYLYPTTILNEMGVTIMSNMSSNYDLIRQNGGAAAAWEGEITDNAETTPTYERVPMTPKRLGAYSVFSKQLLVQSSLAVENEVRSNLNIAIGIALETAALNGPGTGNVPLGLLNNTGVNVVAAGTNGAVLTRAMLLELERRLADENAVTGTPQFLMTPALRQYLKNLQTDAGSGRFVWGDDNTVLGYNAQISNLVPKNLTKGTGTALHAVIFGNFAEMYMAQWGGLDIVVDPYSDAKKAQVNVIANSWWDINTRQPKAFAVIKDAKPA